MVREIELFESNAHSSSLYSLDLVGLD